MLRPSQSPPRAPAARIAITTPVDAASPHVLRRAADHGVVDEQDGHRAYPGGGVVHAGDLPIGPPNDAYEREADAVAERVVAGVEAAPVLAAGPGIRRSCSCGGGLHEEERGECTDCRAERLSRAAYGPAPRAFAPPSVQRVLAGPGQALDPPVRASMERAFGHDLGHVRLHTDAAATESAAAVRAHAYAVGAHVVFGAGRYAPATGGGRRLLAHELTHVLQVRPAPIVQRQDIDDVPGVDRPRLPTAPPPAPVPALVPVVDPDEPAHCPRPPTNLGNLAPVPPCPESDQDEPGSQFEFCVDSDVFREPGDRERLRQFAGQQESTTRFTVHAYASKEGPGTSANAHAYNRNLSCHRGKRVARELINAGVHEERIEVLSNGPTERFGAGNREADLARNRVVELSTSATVIRPSTLGPGATARQVADAAKALIERGEYALAADGYLARWSCGHFRSLADAVARTTVVIAPNPASVTEQGSIATTGLNTILLPPTIADTDNPRECAANRIADLAFHHFSRPQLPNSSDQHAAALHMLSLGGFQACSVADTPLTHRTFAQPQAADPKQGLQPACADQPLPGAIAPQRGPATISAPPTFTVDSLDVGQAGGAAAAVSGTLIGTESPPGAITALADVTATGDPREIANYRVGFVQTVREEDNVASYVAGQKIRWRLPLPLRDGPQRGKAFDDPPWFDANSRVDPSAGSFQVQLADFPDIRMFRVFPDLDRTEFVKSTPVPAPPGGQASSVDEPAFAPPRNTDLRNVVDRGRRRIRFDTWLVARRQRPLAPVDHSSTEFLAGRVIDFTITADVTGVLGAQRATGTWSVTSSQASAAEASRVQLRGATPADFITPRGVLFNEFLVSEGAPARGQDPRGMNFRQFRDAVEQIAEAPRRARGLTRRLTIQVRVDLTTGRVILDSPALRAVRVEATSGDPPIDAAAATTLARDTFPDIRKLVLGDDGVIHSGTGPLSLPVTVSELSP